MRVTIFGTGYVGLVQAAVFADVGHDVCCVDIDEAKVRNLENGIMPIFEPGLKELVQAAVEEGRLAFTTDAAKGVARRIKAEPPVDASLFRPAIEYTDSVGWHRA